ncbi:hypothetical protein EDB80DRAFT_27020 [Ilyonectria destructans]|nr:hypothetical protein EDB80DRAFT_27020 [Ilyonectria destructans]
MTPLSSIHWLSAPVGRGVVASVGWFWAASRTISQGALTMASLFQTPPRDRSYQDRRRARRQEQRSSDAEPPRGSHGLTRAHSGSHSLIRAPWLPARTNGSGRDAVPRMPHEGVPCPVEGHPEMVEEPMLGIYSTHTLVSGRSGGEESVHGTLYLVHIWQSSSSGVEVEFSHAGAATAYSHTDTRFLYLLLPRKWS